MCYHPWVGLDISPQGEFKPCCKYSNVLAKSLDEYNASGMLKEMQDDFLAGREHAGCSRCWKDEAAGLPSKRTLDNEYIFNNEVPDLSGIKVLGMTFGNTCNLACRICSSYPSSRWGKEAMKLKDKLPEIKVFGHNQYYRDSDFIKHLTDQLGQVLHVEFAGGEPFYANQDSHLEILKHLIDTCDPGQISLHYITNGTRMPDVELLNFYWSHFKKVDIQISIDGTGTKFEYNRWPAKWTTLDNVVLPSLIGYKDSSSNIQISISHTVSIFTLYDLPYFIQWCDSKQLPRPYLGLLTNPGYYNITVLPVEAKNKIEDHFNKFNMPDVLGPIIKAMRSNDTSSLLDVTAKYVKILDTHRQQSFAKTFPETFQLLGERCQTLYQLY
jgi:MoaA/NifB/PqqE/SkfB family radical SAM enzyme